MEITWTGHSARTRNGIPDARYGYFYDSGSAFFVKAIEKKANLLGSLTIEQEKKVLQALTILGLRSPELFTGSMSLLEPFLASRYCGVAFSTLFSEAASDLSASEVAALIDSLFDQCIKYASKNVACIDLASPNVVAMPEHGIDGGRLKLGPVTLIDHAWTLAPGAEIRFPIWIQRDMARIPPEMTALIEQDQQEIVSKLAALGYTNLDVSTMSDTDFEGIQSALASMDIKQVVAGAVQAGAVDLPSLYQWQIGRIVQEALSNELLSGDAVHDVAHRLLMNNWKDRYPSLREAQDTWRKAAQPTDEHYSEHPLKGLIAMRKGHSTELPGAGTAPLGGSAHKRPDNHRANPRKSGMVLKAASALGLIAAGWYFWTPITSLWNQRGGTSPSATPASPATASPQTPTTNATTAAQPGTIVNAPPQATQAPANPAPIARPEVPPATQPTQPSAAPATAITRPAPMNPPTSNIANDAALGRTSPPALQGERLAALPPATVSANFVGFPEGIAPTLMTGSRFALAIRANRTGEVVVSATNPLGVRSENIWRAPISAGQEVVTPNFRVEGNTGLETLHVTLRADNNEDRQAGRRSAHLALRFVHAAAPR